MEGLAFLSGNRVWCERYSLGVRSGLSPGALIMVG